MRTIVLVLLTLALCVLLPPVAEAARVRVVVRGGRTVVAVNAIPRGVFRAGGYHAFGGHAFGVGPRFVFDPVTGLIFDRGAGVYLAPGVSIVGY